MYLTLIKKFKKTKEIYLEIECVYTVSEPQTNSKNMRQISHKELKKCQLSVRANSNRFLNSLLFVEF